MRVERSCHSKKVRIKWKPVMRDCERLYYAVSDFKQALSMMQDGDSIDDLFAPVDSALNKVNEGQMKKVLG